MEPTSGITAAESAGESVASDAGIFSRDFGSSSVDGSTTGASGGANSRAGDGGFISSSNASSDDTGFGSSTGSSSAGDDGFGPSSCGSCPVAEVSSGGSCSAGDAGFDISSAVRRRRGKKSSNNDFLTFYSSKNISILLLFMHEYCFLYFALFLDSFTHRNPTFFHSFAFCIVFENFISWTWLVSYYSWFLKSYYQKMIKFLLYEGY